MQKLKSLDNSYSRDSLTHAEIKLKIEFIWTQKKSQVRESERDLSFIHRWNFNLKLMTKNHFQNFHFRIFRNPTQHKSTSWKHTQQQVHGTTSAVFLNAPRRVQQQDLRGCESSSVPLFFPPEMAMPLGHPQQRSNCSRSDPQPNTHGWTTVAERSWSPNHWQSIISCSTLQDTILDTTLEWGRATMPSLWRHRDVIT